MKKITLEKMAEQDAERWAAAEMFYGEGAGTRRKLLDAELQTKLSDGDYENAFYNAYNSLNLDKFAERAIKERQKIDRAAKAGKNFNALKRGNLTGLSNGIFIVVGVAYVAHATGYDKKIEAKATELYRKAKVKVEARHRKGAVYNVFNNNEGTA